jgi:Tol biopolymer transport system component
VYFIRNTAGTPNDDVLCKAPINGSGTIADIRNISNGYYAYSGMFDPAGQYFIWSGLANAGATNFYIASLPADNLAGGSITTLESNTASSGYGFIFVTSSKIYYRKLVSSVYQIHDMTLVGGSKTQRTTGAGAKSTPVVSPDESKILYTFTSGSDNYIVSADTTPDMSGYYTNTATWINNAGNLTELASDWRGVQL